jgi:hypothetical protein
MEETTVLLTKEAIQNNEGYIEGLLNKAAINSRTEGMRQLVMFLADEQVSDFYTAPARRTYHLPIPGGLAQHSINVYRILYKKMVTYYGKDEKNWPWPIETVIIVALLHDVCKIGTYQLLPVEYITDKQQWKLNKEWGFINTDKISMDVIKRFQNYCFTDGQIRSTIYKEVASNLIDWLTKNPYNNPMPELPEEAPPSYKAVDDMPLGHGEKSLSFLQDFLNLDKDEKLAIRWHMGPWDIYEYYGQKAFDEAKKVPLVNLLYISDYEASHLMDSDLF